IELRCAPTFPVAQHHVALGDCARQREGTALCPCRPTPPGEALRRENRTTGGVEFRHSTLDAAPARYAGSIPGRLPRWLRHHHRGGVLFSQPSLQVLFCTWLA